MSRLVTAQDSSLHPPLQAPSEANEALSKRLTCHLLQRMRKTELTSSQTDTGVASEQGRRIAKLKIYPDTRNPHIPSQHVTKSVRNLDLAVRPRCSSPGIKPYLEESDDCESHVPVLKMRSRHAHKACPRKIDAEVRNVTTMSYQCESEEGLCFVCWRLFGGLVLC